MKIKVLMIAACMTITMVQAAPSEPNQKAFEVAVGNYLRESGHLCVGKFVWPIDVSEHDRQIGTNDALQMPVLEKLGLVSSSQITGHGESSDNNAGSVWRYALTPAGKKYYLQQKISSVGPGDQPLVHQGDFCVAQLSLDKVIGWKPITIVSGHQQTTVTYTYKIKAAEWASNAEVLKVFPRIDQVIQGEGTLQLQEALQLTNHGWVAAGLGT